MNDPKEAKIKEMIDQHYKKNLKNKVGPRKQN